MQLLNSYEIITTMNWNYVNKSSMGKKAKLNKKKHTLKNLLTRRNKKRDYKNSSI